MDSNCRKLGETPYRECRKQAAIYNDALGSMERAAEMLGVSVNTLSNYELGVTVPPVDIIIVMADLFAQKASSSATSYTTMLCFSRANSIYDEYGVNMGCNLIGNWYTLKRSAMLVQ